MTLKPIKRDALWLQLFLCALCAGRQVANARADRHGAFVAFEFFFLELPVEVNN